MKVKCPTCQAEMEYSKENPNRPFCSERCRLIDLGDWAGQNHRIAGKSAKDTLFSEQLEGLQNPDDNDLLH